MPFFPKTKEEIVRKSLNQLRAQTNITQLTPGGKARFLIETMSKEQAAQQQLFDANLVQPFIKYAEGKFLDYFGDMLNLPRVEASHSESTGNNFFFYVDSGNFGDINNGNSFQIPVGTIIKTPELKEDPITPGISNQKFVQYVTSTTVTCEASASLVYVPIRASVEGGVSTVPRNVLTSHAFTSYSKSNKNLLKCTNKYSIDNGTNRESDRAYRYRLQNIFAARYLATEASIRLAALSVPGVNDVTIVNCEQGPGTFTLYIDSIASTVSPNLVSRVSEAIAPVVAEGIRAFVSGSKILGLELIIAINWNPRARKEDIAESYRSIREKIESIMSYNKMGDAISLYNIIDFIGNNRLIDKIGLKKPNSFEEVYIYKQGPDGTGVIRNVHIGDTIEPLYNEKVILETGTKYRGIQFITF